MNQRLYGSSDAIYIQGGIPWQRRCIAANVAQIYPQIVRFVRRVAHLKRGMIKR
jgi:hypothetical protein